MTGDKGIFVPEIPFKLGKSKDKEESILYRLSDCNLAEFKLIDGNLFWVPAGSVIKKVLKIKSIYVWNMRIR